MTHSLRTILMLAGITAALSACHTPENALRNPQTGQEATCGGGNFSPWLGDYQDWKKSDIDCKQSLYDQGFGDID